MKANSHLDVALGNKRPLLALGGSCAPWDQGVERNLQIMSWVIGTWPPVLKVAHPGPADREMFLPGTSVIPYGPL